jgi:cell division protein ZapA
MSDVRITINGRQFDIACDPGQEQRVLQLASLVDQRVHQIARAGSAYNDSHLMVLALLTMADEIMGGEYVAPKPSAAGLSAAKAADLKALVSAAEAEIEAKYQDKSQKDAELLAKTLGKITKRIDALAGKLDVA